MSQIDSNSQAKRQAAFGIITHLVDHGFIGLYAGGYVRDLLLGKGEESDIDIATNATPKTISELFPQTIGVGEQFGVMIVVQKGFPFEVATFRSDIGIKDGRHPEQVVFTDAKTDAERRDFTINGMFYDPLEQKVIDYIDGQKDLKSGIIRAIGDPTLRFNEDFLRILRAVRFAARFDFTIESATWEAIKGAAEKIVNVSQERIFAELDKMLHHAHPDRALDLLHKSGILKYILPEVDNMTGIEQPPEFHPEGDVLTHVIKALNYLPESPSQALPWSVLLHDIGKPSTMTFSDRIRFNNHDHVGAELSKEVLKRLRAPNALIDSVYECVDNHMHFMNVTKMRISTLKRFMARSTIMDELELHRIDCLASHGDISNFDFLKEQMEVLEVGQIKPDPLISGKDLISLGLKPGPLFGQILSEVYDLQLEDKVTSKEEAMEFVRGKWVDMRS